MSVSSSRTPPDDIGAPFSQSSAASLEKKRERDRRAQQRLRNKKNGRIVELERKVEELQQICDSLQSMNRLLLSRQATIATFVRSWDENSASPTMPQVSPFSASVSASVLPDDDSVLVDGLPPVVPEWAKVPLMSRNKQPGEMQARWTQIDPKAAIDAPDQPSPLDLLFGSKRNQLADVVHADMRQWRCRDPERLGAGWLVYLYAKWAEGPTEKTYAQLPVFMRPIPEQFNLQHLGCMDGFFWPQIRRNLILKQGQYNFPELVGLYACCLRVDWKWGENMLEPGENSELTIRPEFYNTFMSLDGWKLSDDFIKAYPEIVEGLDTDAIRYELK